MKEGEHMSQIICCDVALGYDGKIFTDKVSFKIDEGDFLCVVGENGAGKSTLIKAILKLIAPIRGEIIMGDGIKPEEIGYLPQQTAVQRDFPASVREIVMSGCLNRCGLRPFYSKAEKLLAEANMKRLGIEKLASRCYRELSGGQQQRVLLARALCAAKKMILLDEPAAGLDPVAIQELYSLIGELNEKDNLTVVMVSHDIASAVKYAKNILHLGSRQMFFGGTAEYIKSDVGRAFFDCAEGGAGCD